MQVSGNSVKANLQKVWPDLRPMVTDRAYWLFTPDKLLELVVGSYMENYRYTAEMFDCDDFAVVLKGFVAQERYVEMEMYAKNREQWFSYPFGVALASRIKGGLVSHALNVAATTDGIYLVEPQNDRIWKADRTQDDIYWCFI